MAEKKATSIFAKENFNMLLVLALIVCAFVIGYLFNKVQSLEKKPATNTQVVDNNANKPQPETWTVADLPTFATQVGIDKVAFENCQKDPAMADLVQKQYESGIEAGITGTPGNILLNIKTGKTQLIPGAVPYASLKASIDQILSGSTTTTPTETVKVDPVSDNDHVRGNKNATIALIEYSDYECPFCKTFHSTAQQSLEEYRDNLMWVYRHFPLDQLHPKARPAAIAAECVAKLGGNDAFWKFSDAIFGVN